MLTRLRSHPLLDGRPAARAALAQQHLDAGADRVVLHGSAPAEVRSVVAAFTAGSG